MAALPPTQLKSTTMNLPAPPVPAQGGDKNKRLKYLDDLLDSIVTGTTLVRPSPMPPTSGGVNKPLVQAAALVREAPRRRGEEARPLQEELRRERDRSDIVTSRMSQLYTFVHRNQRSLDPEQLVATFGRGDPTLRQVRRFNNRRTETEERRRVLTDMIVNMEGGPERFRDFRDQALLGRGEEEDRY